MSKRFVRSFLGLEDLTAYFKIAPVDHHQKPPLFTNTTELRKGEMRDGPGRI